MSAWGAGPAAGPTQTDGRPAPVTRLGHRSLCCSARTLGCALGDLLSLGEDRSHEPTRAMSPGRHVQKMGKAGQDDSPRPARGHSWCDLDGLKASRMQGWWTVTPRCQQLRPGNSGLPAQGLGVVTF